MLRLLSPNIKVQFEIFETQDADERNKQNTVPTFNFTSIVSNSRNSCYNRFGQAISHNNIHRENHGPKTVDKGIGIGIRRHSAYKLRYDFMYILYTLYFLYTSRYPSITGETRCGVYEERNR